MEENQDPEEESALDFDERDDIGSNTTIDTPRMTSSIFRQKIFEAQIMDEEYSMAELTTNPTINYEENASQTLKEMDALLKRIKDWNESRTDFMDGFEAETPSGTTESFDFLSKEEEEKGQLEMSQAEKQLLSIQSGVSSLEKIIDSSRGPQCDLLDLSILEKARNFPTIEVLEKELQESKFKLFEEEFRLVASQSLDSSRREDEILSEGLDLQDGVFSLQLQFQDLGRDLDSILSTLEPAIQPSTSLAVDLPPPPG